MLTECLAETDHKDEAAALFEEYINNHDDKDITALSYLGEIYVGQEDYEKALNYLYQAESLGRSDSWIYITIGYVLMQLDNIEKAADILESILEQTEYKGYVELELAVCYALLNDKEKADFYLNDAKLLVEDDSELEEAEQLIQLMNNPKYFS